MNSQPSASMSRARQGRLLVAIAVSLAAFTAGGCVIVVDDTSDWDDTGDYRSGSRRPRIGIETESVGPALANQLNIDRHRSTLVESVHSGSPAAHAGVQRWDVITQVDGSEAASPSELRRAIRAKESGETIRLRVIRAGAPIDLDVKIE